MTMTTQQRRHRILDIVRTKPGLRFQFGQPTALFLGGTTGCSATAVQLQVLIWKGEVVSLDEVGRAVGYPDANQRRNHIGLYDHQVIEALRHFGIRYEGRTDLDAEELRHIAAYQGPVLFACTYRYWPEWYGATYLGAKADGSPNGYARPLGEAGKDQLRGFEDGRHMGTLLTYRHRPRRPEREDQLYLRDSNHNSGLRPADPPFDIVSPHQWDVLYRSARQTSRNGKPYAAIPLRTWEGQRS